MIVSDQYPPMVGGVPTVTQGLATDLVDRGHQVWVVAPSYGVRDVHRIEHKVHIHRFASFEWPTYEEVRIPFLPILPFRKLLKKADPDIIHIHSPVVLGNIARTGQHCPDPGGKLANTCYRHQPLYAHKYHPLTRLRTSY